MFTREVGPDVYGGEWENPAEPANPQRQQGVVIDWKRLGELI